MSQTKRVLVTGAGGFIGRWSVAPLLGKGYEVHAVLSKNAHAPFAQEIHGASVHCADLLSEAGVEELVKGVKPTHLLHFAWIATPGIYWQSPDNARWLAASQYLLRCFRAAGGVRAVMAGSCVEYDWSRVGVCIEQTSPLADAGAKAPTPYAASKIAMQKDLARFAAEQHLSAAWGRVFLQYGPYEHPERLVPSVIRQLLLSREALCTHGRQVRGFLHVTDLGAAFAQLLDSEVQGPVNMGSDEAVALSDLIGRIAQQIGRPDLIRLGARSAAADEPPILLADVHRLRDEVQWRPRFSLNEGIRDTIAWWRAELAARGAS
ncbi:MAG TPA: NAD(P)-dependent oxidoreductase [Steroidobacteraceae bacterium]|nr:NAD(P)-dependent oxidoreductase [Steroidobacteraceae bacterium]